MLSTPLRLALASLVALAAPAASADPALPATGAPVPFANPYASQPASTGSVGAVNRLANGQNKAAIASQELRAGLEMLVSGDAAGAFAHRDRWDSGALDRSILSWALATQGGALTLAQLREAAGEVADWPGQAAIRRNLERTVPHEHLAASEVIALIGPSPSTFQGTKALAAAHIERGETDAAKALVSASWRTARLEAAEESAFLKQFGSLLSVSDHRVRMERMLHQDRIASAVRAAPRAKAEELAKAWAAVIRRERNAGALLDAVPKAQRGSGYAFAKARHLRWSGKYADAAKVMLAAPTDPELLADPDAWWIERRVLSREMLDIDDPTRAYKIAAGHAAQSPVHIADAEFHAGWYALRHLDDPEKAAAHFQRIAKVADGAISLARAYYWQGRAAEQGAPGEADAHFAQAAGFGTTFYGQLAAAKLKRNAIAAEEPPVTAEDRLSFDARAPVAAIRRIEAAGHGELAAPLYRELARTLDRPGELALLTAMAGERGDHRLALGIAKTAASRGIAVGALSHPLGAIPDTAELADAGKALAYAIARQESEFNATAVSPAGARGLLQLMPRTAQAVAKRTGHDYTAARLTSDPAYNATLGAAYLDEQLAAFDGSYVLTFAGYNAGPSRAREWAARYGDPRGMDADAVIDWIERIPYHETRSYVQRVMENYQVYKMRLSGKVDVASDLTEGR